MLDPKFLEEIAQRLAQAVPSGVRDLEQDISGKFRDILQAAFTKLDLVTREEFDVQVKVLARTRAKLDAMELQFATFEKERKGDQ